MGTTKLSDLPLFLSFFFLLEIIFFYKKNLFLEGYEVRGLAEEDADPPGSDGFHCSFGNHGKKHKQMVLLSVFCPFYYI